MLLGAYAREDRAYVPPFMERLTPEVQALVFPEGDRVELLDDGGPTAAAVYKGESLVGYIFSTYDVMLAPGYDGTPFDTFAGVTLQGRITGSVNIYHHEPLLIGNQRLTDSLHSYLERVPGMSIGMGSTDGPRPALVVGATATARAMRNGIKDSARAVLNYRLPAKTVTEPTVDVEFFEERSPAELLASGAVLTRDVTNREVREALAQQGYPDARIEIMPKGGDDDLYIQLRAGLATPAIIGRNAAGPSAHDDLLAKYPDGSNGIFIASSGAYDFHGYRFQNASTGYRLERIRVLQGDRVFTFDKFHYMKAGIRLGTSSGILVVPPETSFEPLAPWRLEVMVQASTAGGDVVSVALPGLDYKLPAEHILMPEVAPPPAWLEAWIDSTPQLIILGLALTVLTAILGFQHVLTRNRLAHRWIRMGFLGFTFVWLGWIAGAQFSIIHVINYMRAPFESMDLAFYLAEPLIVVLGVYIAVSLILLGRGVFCGWLCPFGALQELLANFARWLKLPQFNPPDHIQRRLWWGKYASATLVLGLAFFVPNLGATAAEIEPFKTAISAHFLRAWPYVVYAVALLAIGLFTERAFCRFFCPLGGVLAVLDRLHLIELLKRRPECGSPCHLCERSCPVRAIVPSGKIVMAECFQCLDCQVEYYDDKRCPPLAKIRKQLERVKKGKPVLGGTTA